MAEQIIEIAKLVERTHVVFNNNWKDQGQRNAKTLMQILGGYAIQP